jgi:hypothetical protein
MFENPMLLTCHMTLEFGLDSFADVMTDASGRRLSDAETLRTLVDEAVLAESLGIDIVSIGEHYRADMMDSAPAVILSNIAARTERLRLGTSVTVLSTNDPVRTFHDFSTLDAVSNGRAQLVVGRASRTDSFPLFGFDLPTTSSSSKRTSSSGSNCSAKSPSPGRGCRVPTSPSRCCIRGSSASVWKTVVCPPGSASVGARNRSFVPPATDSR